MVAVYRRDLGFLFDWATNDQRRAEYQIAVEKLQAYIVQNYPLKLTKNLLGSPLKIDQYFSLAGRLNELGIHPGFARAWLAEKGYKVMGSNRVVILQTPVSHSKLNLMKSDFEDLCGLKEACNIVGVSKRTLLKLLEGKLIRLEKSEAPELCGFSRSNLLVFRKAIFKDAKKRTSLVQAISINASRNTYAKSLVEILTLLQQSNVRPLESPNKIKRIVDLEYSKSDFKDLFGVSKKLIL